jgi:hypothetical protein
MTPEKYGLLAVPRAVLKFDIVCHLYIAQVVYSAHSQAKPYDLYKVLGNLRTNYMTPARVLFLISLCYPGC